MNSKRQHIPELDGIRGIAIALVLLWHFIGLPLLSAKEADLRRLGSIFILGRSGVDLFFVLSGFLIGGILLRHRDASNLFRVFYYRRACRILPIYLIIAGSFALGHLLSSSSIFASDLPLWSYFLFLQNCVMGSLGSYGNPWLAATWSLAVEEQFYLFFPLCVYVFPRSQIRWLCLAIAILSIVVRPLLFYWSEHGYLASYFWAPARLDGLMAGALCAIAWQEETTRQLLVTHTRTLRFLLMILAFVIPILSVALKGNAGFHMAIWGHTFLTVFYTIFLLMALTSSVNGPFQLLRCTPLLFLGRVSYGLYLIHPIAILLLVPSRHGGGINGASDMFYVGVAFVLSLLLSQLSYSFIERKFIRLGHSAHFSTET